MSDPAAATPTETRVPIGRAVIPLQFGEQVIVSILYNHDANPVHHRPDHAIQWMLGLLAAQGVGGTDGLLASAGPAERTYTLGTRLLAHQDIVVMPGVALASICFERFIDPSELTTSISTTFTYPLLVPTKGEVEVIVEAYEIPDPTNLPGCRKIQIEAFGPSLTGVQTRLMKLDAVVFRAGMSRDDVYEHTVKPQFEELSKTANKLPGMPELAHPSSISQEDRRRYNRIVEPGSDAKARPITEAAWQCKIPRVLTEVIDILKHNEPYQKEVRTHYAGRADEAERIAAIRRYVEKERKYNLFGDDKVAQRIEKLAGMQQHLYARQHTVFDPRHFKDGAEATTAGTQILLDLHLSEIRLRRAMHRFYTCGKLKSGEPVFMGESTVMAQPLVTKELANFLCEINHAFDTLKLLEYKR
ncbi:MAG: hypothetical protein WCT04_09110 [Planctomycetota bacterium]